MSLTLVAIPDQEVDAAKAAAPGLVKLQRHELSQNTLIVIDARQFTLASGEKLSPEAFVKAQITARSFAAQLNQALHHLTGLVIPTVVSAGDSIQAANPEVMARLGWQPIKR